MVPVVIRLHMHEQVGHCGARVRYSLHNVYFTSMVGILITTTVVVKYILYTSAVCRIRLYGDTSLLSRALRTFGDLNLYV